MNRDDIETLREVCYMLRGYINRIYGGPDNVDWRQQDDYEREMQEAKDALEVIDRLEGEK